MLTKRMLIVTSLAVGLLAAGCSSGTEVRPNTATTRPGDEGTNRQRIIVEDGRRAQLLRIDYRGNAITIVSRLGQEEDHITATPSKEGVRVYSLGGADVVESRVDADGFKLKGPAGETRWKVKVKADKTEVREGEEVEVYSLRPKNADRVDVREGDVDRGRVDRTGSRKDIRVKDAAGTVVAEVTFGDFSDAYGALLMTRIPPTERAVLVAELFGRGR